MAGQEAERATKESNTSMTKTAITKQHLFTLRRFGVPDRGRDRPCAGFIHIQP